MADLAPPPGWTTPDVPNGALPPVDGPTGSGGEILSAPPGSVHDAGSTDLIAGTVAGSIAAAMSDMAEHEADTHAQGSTLGDLMPLPSPPDIDTTVLLGPPA